jgi:hypothetical protein
MASLGIYGKILREYEGKGSLTLYDGQTCNCSVRAVQIADGKIIADCLFTEDLDLVRKCLDRNDAIKSIMGTTSKNDEFLLGGQILYTNFNDRTTPNGNTISMVVLAGSMTSKKQTNNSLLKLVKFGLVNFDFAIGNKFKEYANDGGGLDILAVELGVQTVDIHEIQGYKSVMESVKAQRGIDVTSEAVVNISSLDDLDIVIPLIDTLCKLLSFARGTKINWIYYDCYNDNGDMTSSFHKNNITWQYTGLPVIDPRNPHETASFVEQAYTSYLRQKAVHGLDIAIDSYLDAKREGTYLDTRAIRAVVVLEFLKSRYASGKNLEFILHKNIFRKVTPSLKRAIEQQFKELSLPEDALQEMKPKVSELNRKSFRAILENMFEDLGILVSKEDLGRFIKIRNSLVHRASFLTKKSWQEYVFLINILDRIFLRILNYSGVYLDITNKFERVNTIPLKAP